MKRSKTVTENMINSELNICKMHHPNIVQIYEIIKFSDVTYIVMEYCADGELFTYISEFAPLQEPEICFYLHQIVESIIYCHKMNIIHRYFNFI